MVRFKCRYKSKYFSSVLKTTTYLKYALLAYLDSN